MWLVAEMLVVRDFQRARRFLARTAETDAPDAGGEDNCAGSASRLLTNEGRTPGGRRALRLRSVSPT